MNKQHSKLMQQLLLNNSISFDPFYPTKKLDFFNFQYLIKLIESFEKCKKQRLTNVFDIISEYNLTTSVKNDEFFEKIYDYL